MLKPAATYDEVYRSFKWEVPAGYNIARETVDRHAAATPDAPALIYEAPDGKVATYGFRAIQRLANKAANAFAAHGIRRGDRVGIMLGQTPETAVAHAACWKMGAVSIPLFTLFGEEAAEYRLDNAGASALVTDRENYPKIAAVRERLPALKTVFLIDGAESGALDFAQVLEKASDRFETVETGADDPAFISYTSGTTGQPKGALHAHRTLIGHMPGFDILYSFFGQEGDLCWSPADWAWLAGLMDVLFPAWWHGKPVLAFRAKGRFDPEQAYHMMARHRVRNALLVPTMLKMMRQVRNPPAVRLRSMFSGGETVGIELLQWAEGHFGIPINEGYGQTECNLVMAHVPSIMPPRPGSIGLPVPGHEVAIVDEEGIECAPGVEGQIAFRRPNPVMLLEYWNNPEATRDKYVGDWLLTGDMGVRDGDGYIWFVGRADDVITSSGYRIGPGEIEDCLLKHPAVALAAAVGVPDPVRTEIVKAFIVPVEGATPDERLENEIRAFVRARLAQYEYPREIAFVKDMPTTATGKVMRRVLRQQEIERRGGTDAGDGR